MTDPVTPDPTTPPAAPAAPAYSPAPVGVKQTLSLVSFIVGLVAFLFGWALIFGLAAGIVAIILGVLGRKREPGAPKWMWLVGIIAGAVGGATSLVITIVFFVALAVAAAGGYR
ncbi:MAG: hypothetical protein QOK08_2184 [Actinomycetota bacterium]|jgi:hypothetical protein|nr:hypothetical protein [Actinomycetota bacterium]MDQ1574551.1 hypothetical protein [Actinomycetota bacterium]